MELLTIDPFIDENLVKVTCRSTKNVAVGIIVQDEQGRPFFNAQYQLEEGLQTIEFPLTGFSPGKYHVWMSCEGKMKMGAFTFEGIPVKKKTPRFSDMMAQIKVLPSFILPKNESPE